MLRKKESEMVAGQVDVACPACGCTISPSGQVLYVKSAKYLEWIKTGEVLGSLEQKFSELVPELDSYRNDLEVAEKRIQVLELQLKEANARLEQKENVVRQEGREKPAVKKQSEW